MKLFVEGGGNTGDLEAACRRALTTFITRAGTTRRPRIVACGSRRNAYESFRTAVARGEAAMLLVDSEAPVAAAHQTGPPDDWQPWGHLKAHSGDGWDRPARAEERHCHLMVQCMEHWFIADRIALMTYFGQGFAPNALPKRPDVENVPKRAVFDGLARATKSCKTKPPYDKGAHSFEILALVDPALVAKASPWGKRFLDEMQGIP